MAIIDPYTQLRGIETIPGAAGQEYKTNLFNQYQDIAAQSEGDVNRANITYADSPIFNQGLGQYDPASFGSQLIQNVALPISKFLAGTEGGGLSGAANVTAYGIRNPTSAAFQPDLVNPVLEGTATPAQKLEFANVFGHEMAHLGWPYKPKNELINVPGVGKEKGFTEAQKQSESGYGAGEEQWNYLHDLMYAPRGIPIDKITADIKSLKDSFNKGEIGPGVYYSALKNQADKYSSGWTTTDIPGKSQSLKFGLINEGDLSYTPKAFNEIAWSGLTTPGKQAIGFGINPFEDTRAAGQWYKQQTAAKRFKQQQLMNQRKQDMQQKIRQHEAAEAAKQKAARDAAAEKQASLQAQVTAQANREARRRVSRGEARDYGKTETRASSGWESSPFEKGGLVDLYRYGGFSG